MSDRQVKPKVCVQKVHSIARYPAGTKGIWTPSWTAPGEC